MADITNKEIAYNSWTDLAVSSGAASQTIDCDGVPHMVLYATNTDSDDAMITLSAPASTALNRGKGNITKTLAQNDAAIIHIELDQFMDSDPQITLTITDPDGSAFSGTAGNVKLQGMYSERLR